MDQGTDLTPEQQLEMQKQQCVFCSIIAGKIPSKKIYEDDSVLAILDIRPANPGHVLVLPKEHYGFFPQIPPQMMARISKAAKTLSAAMLRGLGAKGTSILVANGVPAGQRASHTIMHVIPRFDEDGVGITLPERSIKEEDLSMLAQRFHPLIQKLTGQQTSPAPEPPSEDDLLAALGGAGPQTTPEENPQDDTGEKKSDSDLDAIAELLK